jgi:hypothetical protein
MAMFRGQQVTVQRVREYVQYLRNRQVQIGQEIAAVAEELEHTTDEERNELAFGGLG